MTSQTETIALTKLVRIYPNAQTRKFFLRNIRYRGECWNKGIRAWEHMYHEEHKYLTQIKFVPKKQGKGKKAKYKIVPQNKYRLDFPIKTTVKKDKKGRIVCYKFKPIKRSHVPSGKSVRDQVLDKMKAEGFVDRIYPNEVIANTLRQDLDQSYQAFFDPQRPDSRKPKIKHFIDGNGSYLDTQAHIKNGRIFPTANGKDPQRKSYRNGIKCAEDISELNGTKRWSIRFIHRDGRFYASIAVKRPVKHLMKTGLDDAVDVNVDHFNSAGYVLWLCQKKIYDYQSNKHVYKNTRLNLYYQRIKKYQQILANKRECKKKHYAKLHKRLPKNCWQTRSYQKARIKLRHAYRKVQGIQHDIVQKYTNYLVKYHDTIYIEDLDVKHMKMSHIASKGLHRSLFGYFRTVLTYKCRLYGRKLVVVDRLFPSTQACPRCGMAKAGKEKIGLNGNRRHRTPHNVFECYHCGYKGDRDAKVVPALMRYSEDKMKEIVKAQKKAVDYAIF